MSGPRRPLASRDTGWARRTAAWLARRAVTPNRISIAGAVFGGMAGGALWASGATDGAARASLLVLAAAGCQARLLCNLFDGMVAIEGGRHAPDGPLWNELPDRVSDLAVLVGAGLAIGEPALGWAAGALAVSVAYVRELGHGIDGVADFSGPMGKPQRMAIVTVAAIVTTLDGLWDGEGGVLRVALWLIVAGAIVTGLRRAHRLRRRLIDAADGAGDDASREVG